MTRVLIGLEEIAELLGVHYDTFRKQRRALPGFPAAVIGKRFSRAAVEAWIADRSAAQGEAARAATAPARVQRQRDELNAIRSRAA